MEETILFILKDIERQTMEMMNGVQTEFNVFVAETSHKLSIISICAWAAFGLSIIALSLLLVKVLERRKNGS